MEKSPVGVLMNSGGEWKSLRCCVGNFFVLSCRFEFLWFGFLVRDFIFFLLEPIGVFRILFLNENFILKLLPFSAGFYVWLLYIDLLFRVRIKFSFPLSLRICLSMRGYHFSSLVGLLCWSCIIRAYSNSCFCSFVLLPGLL